MEQVILEGSPLADYLKENAIQEEVFSWENIKTPNSKISLLKEESSFFQNSTFLFKHIFSLNNFAFFFKLKNNSNNGSGIRLPLKTVPLNTSSVTYLSFRKASLLTAVAALGYVYLSRWVVLIICIFCSCWLWNPNGILAVRSILKEPQSLWTLFSIRNQQLKAEAISQKWNKLSHKLLQRWNYLRELDDLRRGYGLKAESIPLSTHSTQDACTQQVARQDLLRCLLPLALQLVELIPTSMSMSDTDFRTWVLNMKEPFPTLYLNELKYLILELRERIPRCTLNDFLHLEKVIDQTWTQLTSISSFSTFPFPSSSSSSSSSFISSSRYVTPLSNALYTLHHQVHALLVEDQPSSWFLNDFDTEWEKVKRLYTETKHLWTRSLSSSSPCSSSLTSPSTSTTTTSVNTSPMQYSISDSNFATHLLLPSSSSSTMQASSYVLEETLGREPMSSSPVLSSDFSRSSGNKAGSIGRSSGSTTPSPSFSPFLLLDELKNVLRIRNSSLSSKVS